MALLTVDSGRPSAVAANIGWAGSAGRPRAGAWDADPSQGPAGVTGASVAILSGQGHWRTPHTQRIRHGGIDTRIG
jgi:hypothetical protein